MRRVMFLVVLSVTWAPAAPAQIQVGSPELNKCTQESGTFSDGSGTWSHDACRTTVRLKETTVASRYCWNRDEYYDGGDHGYVRDCHTWAGAGGVIVADGCQSGDMWFSDYYWSCSTGTGIQGVGGVRCVSGQHMNEGGGTEPRYDGCYVDDENWVTPPRYLCSSRRSEAALPCPTSLRPAP